MDAFSSEFLTDDRAGGPSQANKSAREQIAGSWATAEGRLSLVSGKKVLGKLSEWAQATYGVSINPTRIARELKKSELPAEVAGVLTAIENNERF